TIIRMLYQVGSRRNSSPTLESESSCCKRIKSGRFIGSFTPKTMKRLMRIECLEQAIEWKEDALKNLKQED
ncbi:MAG: hypothetical protein UF313_09895, partial [Anaerobutyricum hallii]|uniref:hypothetical protein n=1 Tax=Anaerobutyricum hallii TaxID=39488 RepID=UPI002E760AD1